MNAPDFIIMGAMKSATSSLHVQLAAQPNIFMSTPKEPNYFSDTEQFAKGEKWYSSLFDGANGRLAGESSTHYTKLPTYPETAQRIFEALPEVRLIYVMRHPVDRLVSHYIHEWTMRNISCSLEDAVKKHNELIDYGLYAYQLKPYIDLFGKQKILPVFFSALKANPHTEFEKISNFLGANIAYMDSIEPQNQSSLRLREFPGKNLLLESPLFVKLRQLFVPRGVKDILKRHLSMQERPAIPETLRASLETTFNKDLAKLSRDFGAELTCATFDSETRSGELSWQLET